MSLTQTQKNVLKVLERITDSVRKNEDDAEMYAEELEAMLSRMHSMEAFGTEGQADPRGDFRNGEWSMDEVEGVPLES